MAFEQKAYSYLGWYVGAAFILLGLLVAAVIESWPQRIPKQPLTSFDDLPAPPKQDARGDDDRHDGR